MRKISHAWLTIHIPRGLAISSYIPRKLAVVEHSALRMPFRRALLDWHGSPGMFPVPIHSGTFKTTL